MVLGRVVDEDNKPVAAQVFASTQRTLAGALLDAPVNRERVQTIATDSDGRFAIGKLDPGPLRIAVRAKGFAPLDAREVALPVGERLDLGDLHLTRGVIVTGRVLEHDRRAVKDALLSLVSAPLLGPIQRLGPFTESSLGASDAFGHFELPCVATGKWTLRVHAQNFPDALFEIESRPDQARVDDLEFVLPYSASISGTILDFDKRAMPDLTVTATPVDGLQLFHSSKPDGASEEWLAGTRNEEVDPYGRFLIQGLEAGQSYSLRARRKGNIASGADEEVADRWAPITLA